MASAIAMFAPFPPMWLSGRGMQPAYHRRPAGSEVQRRADHEERVMGAAVYISSGHGVPPLGAEADQPREPQIEAAAEAQRRGVGAVARVDDHALPDDTERIPERRQPAGKGVIV